jgi:hypothetical protein
MAAAMTDICNEKKEVYSHRGKSHVDVGRHWRREICCLALLLLVVSPAITKILWASTVNFSANAYKDISGQTKFFGITLQSFYHNHSRFYHIYLVVGAHWEALAKIETVVC